MNLMVGEYLGAEVPQFGVMVRIVRIRYLLRVGGEIISDTTKTFQDIKGDYPM